MNRLLGLGFIIILLLGCQQESKTGVIGQQFLLKADIPNEVGTIDYIWKITALPENSELMLSDIQFSENESQAIFIPDVTGHFTVQVTVWKYNDKLGAFVYNYDITDGPLKITAQQQTRDEWLNENVEVPPVIEDFSNTIEENDSEIVDETVINEPLPETIPEPKILEKETINIIEPPTVVAEANYTIQVAAESNIDSATQHVFKLISAGYDAYSIEHTTADNKTVYRIRIGKFATREDAALVAEKITNDQGLSTWITAYVK